jgi:hypothetical protein
MYAYKGYDRAAIQTGEDVDEINLYLQGHNVSASEACWWHFSFCLHSEKPM